MNVYREPQSRIVPRTPSGRIGFLIDLYAPEDDNGERHPGAGVLTLVEFLTLMEAEL